MNKARHILVTGCAGFIGFHLTRALIARGDRVTGIDNLNAYYDPKLKADRLEILRALDGFSFRQMNIADAVAVGDLFAQEKFDAVVNLAAQAGVRYSLENPQAYIDSNVTGFTNILEGCRHHPVRHLVYASSSSVYGGNRKLPFSVADSVDHPISLYAATKKANELMAHTYAHLFAVPCTGLRFFTVYGPWGRPDMAMYIFAKAIFEGRPIEVFNSGGMKRDFTYIDDIVEGVVRVLDRPPGAGACALTGAPYRLYNIGNNAPVPLTDMIATLEAETGRTAQKIMKPMQPGDVAETYADIDDLIRDTGFRPSTPIAEGIRRFIAWYRDYHKMGNGPADRAETQPTRAGHA